MSAGICPIKTRVVRCWKALQKRLEDFRILICQRKVNGSNLYDRKSPVRIKCRVSYVKKSPLPFLWYKKSSNNTPYYSVEISYFNDINIKPQQKLKFYKDFWNLCLDNCNLLKIVIRYILQFDGKTGINAAAGMCRRDADARFFP